MRIVGLGWINPAASDERISGSGKELRVSSLFRLTPLRRAPKSFLSLLAAVEPCGYQPEKKHRIKLQKVHFRRKCGGKENQIPRKNCVSTERQQHHNVSGE
jgi:hypothetical protein